MEEWKLINGYDGRYAISNYGNIKSLWHEHSVGFKDRTIKRIYEEKNIVGFDNGNGYIVVTLSKNSRKKNHYIHRLVAEYFLGEISDEMVVNHKDFNTKNNNVSNLELCTQKENINYSLSHGRGRRKPRRTSLGESYIYLNRYNTFTVVIDRKYKSFKTIEEAKKYRDSVLEGKDAM